MGLAPIEHLLYADTLFYICYHIMLSSEPPQGIRISGFQLGSILRPQETFINI